MLPSASYQLKSCDPSLVDELRRELRCSETLAWVLARRGIDADEARALMVDDPAGEDQLLHDPMLLGDMSAAVERIRFAIDEGEPIVVHGDYDADGVCATTLLVEGLEQLGADVHAFLPDRFTNGYGLQIDQVERFARDGMRLLIAVDCGITAIEPVAHARDLGMDVVVCDHHQPGDTLPDAIICSTRPSDYPFPDLCATTVAGKLLIALGGPSTASQHELEAIATIADCMPLVGENRVIVKRGLRALGTTTRPGLRALAEQSGVRCPDIDAEAVAFKLAPRINAVGRIDSSERAYELLRSDESQATKLAQSVDATNEERRRIERTICDAALEQVESWSEPERDARIYVVHGTGWHEGVVGIVASRLVERYHRPVIVISDGDPARGSGRSIDGVDLHAALAACDDLLVRWGGHAQAGGLTIDPTRIGELRMRLAAWGRANIPDSLLTPHDELDAIVPGSELTFGLVTELERLAPYGTAWPRPTLLAIDATVDQPRAIGADGTHLRCTLVVGGSRVSGIGFGMAPSIPDLVGRPLDVAVIPSINRYRGAESLQVRLERGYEVPDVDCTSSPQWCAASCGHAGDGRITISEVLDAAAGLVPPAIADADPDVLPAIEPLLAHPGVIDLRNRSIGIEYLAQLLAAGADVVAVVADLPRRRSLFTTLVARPGLAVDRLDVIGERCSPQRIREVLQQRKATPRTPGFGARLLVVDQHSLEHVFAAGGPFQRILVFDPPMTIPARDQLASVVCDALDLVFGTREARFSADALRSAKDVRATMAEAYRRLRDDGPQRGESLADLLWGTAGEFPRSTNAIIHGVRTLVEREIITLDGNDGLRVVQSTPVPASRA